MKSLYGMSESLNPLQRDPDAVQTVKGHVDKKTIRYHSRFRNGTHNKICCYGKIGVKGVKPYAAPVGVIDRVGQEVVQVNEHGQHHDKPYHFPSGAEKKPRKQNRYEEMEGQVKHLVHRITLFVETETGSNS